MIIIKRNIPIVIFPLIKLGSLFLMSAIAANGIPQFATGPQKWVLKTIHRECDLISTLRQQLYLLLQTQDKRIDMYKVSYEKIYALIGKIIEVRFSQIENHWCTSTSIEACVDKICV